MAPREARRRRDDTGPTASEIRAAANQRYYTRRRADAIALGLIREIDDPGEQATALIATLADLHIPLATAQIQPCLTWARAELARRAAIRASAH